MADNGSEEGFFNAGGRVAVAQNDDRFLDDNDGRLIAGRDDDPPVSARFGFGFGT